MITAPPFPVCEHGFLHPPVPVPHACDGCLGCTNTVEARNPPTVWCFFCMTGVHSKCANGVCACFVVHNHQ